MPSITGIDIGSILSLFSTIVAFVWLFAKIDSAVQYINTDMKDLKARVIVLETLGPYALKSKLDSIELMQTKQGDILTELKVNAMKLTTLMEATQFRIDSLQCQRYANPQVDCSDIHTH